MKLLHRLLMFVAAGGLVASGAWLVTADETAADKKADAKAADRSADEDAIRQTADKFAKAYNAADAKAIAAEFIEDGEYVDEFKNIFKGREAIAKEFAAFFEASPGNQVEIKVDSIRFVGPGMAIEEGTIFLTPPDDSPAVDSHYVAVHLKQEGKWEVAVTRDLDADVPTPHEHLRKLEFLVGDWIDESDDATTHTSTRWSDDGNFILSDFHIEATGLRTMDGTQRIGWDPVAKQIRSWVFDSEGGFVEGAWTPVGDDWIVKVTGVRPDGVVGSATNIYTQLDGKTIRWSTTERIVDGQLEADVSVVMVRKAPSAEPQATDKPEQPAAPKEKE